MRIVWILLVLLPSVQSWAVDVYEELQPVPLCRALENLQVGDQIPIVVSGVYFLDYLFDPDELRCRLDIHPSTCVELSPSLELPREFENYRNEWGTYEVTGTFRGVLHGPPEVPTPPFDSSISAAHRALIRNSQGNLYFGNQYRTKLVVDGIESFGPVPEDLHWPKQQDKSEDEPLPVEMALPTYPPIARNIDYEGVVLVAVTVVAGEVTDARIQFGDAVLVTEVLDNVKTWRFAPDVSTDFTVEYDFRLEKRPINQGKNPRFEMRLPTYIKVLGARRNH